MRHKNHMPLDAAMEEVHKNMPMSVRKSDKKGKAKEAMLRAIAFSKAGKSRPKPTSVKVF